jgi:hypothetical protein
MALGRRLFVGGFTAGAVSVAAGGATPAAADDGVTVFPGQVSAEGFTADSGARTGFFKTTSVSEHAVTVYQAGQSGSGAALNIISDNPDTSAVYVRGVESGRGSVKIAHVGRADGSDASASGLSIDLQTAGTAAQGIFVTATQGPTSGSLITLRNNAGLDDFVVKGTGRIGVGISRGATPRGQVHIVQQPGTPAGLLVEGVVRIGDATAAPAGGDAAGGGALYAAGGALMWRGSNGTVTRIAPA